MLPHPNEIQYFLEVAATLNISRAAERLGITQPTLSLSVQRLEHSLGTPLLLRSKTGVRLTKAGLRFSQEAKALVDQWGRLKSDSLRDESEIRGRVSIGCHPAVALYSVGNFAGKLMRSHPELELVFHHDLSRKITERLISFETDIGIVVNPVSHPDLRIVTLATDDVTFWKGPGEIAEDVLICDPDLNQTQDLLAKLKRQTGAKGAPVFKRMIHSGSLEVIARLVASGAGIGVLPRRVATREPSDRLKPAFVKSPVFHDKVCLAYRTDSQRSQAAKVVVHAIQAAFA